MASNHLGSMNPDLSGINVHTRGAGAAAKTDF